MYYNTTNESGEILENNKSKSISQTDYIHNLFKDGKKLSASKIAPKMNCPITSIRRSLNTLMEEGKIEKLDEKVKGMYGRNEHLYKKN